MPTKPTAFSYTRLRLRSALRRTVSSMHMIVVPRGAYRLAAVTVAFAGSESIRNFLVMYRPAARPGGVLAYPPRWAVLSIKHPDDGLPFDNFDLRRPHSEELEDFRSSPGWKDMADNLEAYPKAMIEKLLAKGTEMPVVG